jgi:hypothetical protein
MLSQTIEWRPASLCSIEGTDNSFGGSVEAVAGGGGGAVDIGGFDAAGNTAGAAGSSGANPFDSPGAGLSMTGADAASLGGLAAVTAGGYFGVSGWIGAVLNATGFSAAFMASNPFIAAGHLGQDVALSLGNTLVVDAPAFGGQQ